MEKTAFPGSGVKATSLALACVLALVPASRSDAQSGTFSITRIVACQGVNSGGPIGAAVQFPTDAGRIFIWFESTPAPRDIPMRTEWYINEAHVGDASYDLKVDQGARSGYVSLALPQGTLFPEGDYRVELTSGGLVVGSHRFSVRGRGAAVSSAPAPQPALSAPPAAPMLRRPELGFAVSVPTGWVEKPDPETAATIVQESRPEIGAMVFVQTEPAPAAVTDMLVKAVARLKANPDRQLVSSRFGTVLDRSALIAVLEDKAARYKLTLLPRDAGDASRGYYGVMTMAPLAAFAGAEPMLDRIAAGFQILPVTESPRPAASANDAPRPAASREVFDRGKVLDRILAPSKPVGR